MSYSRYFGSSPDGERERVARINQKVGRENAAARKAKERMTRDKANVVEFSLRVLFPMITVKRVMSIALEDKSVPKASGRQSRARPLSMLNTVTALSTPTTFFSQSYCRPLYKTAAVFDAIAVHMHIAAARITNEYADACGITRALTPEYEACAYAALQAVYDGYACVDGLFCDLFRMLLGEAYLPSEPNKNVVAYDILKGISGSVMYEPLRETIGGNPALSATAAVMMLLSHYFAAATGYAAGAAGANASPSMERQPGESISVNAVDGVDSLHDNTNSNARGEALSKMQDSLKNALASVTADLCARARENGVPTGKTQASSAEAQHALSSMASSMLSPEAADALREGDSIHGDHRGRGLDDGEFSTDPAMLRESLSVFRTLVSTKVSARQSHKPRMRYDYRTNMYEPVDNSAEDGETYSETLQLATVLDVWTALGRVEGFMTDAVSKSRHGDGEIVGVECGSELMHMLPHEMLNLAIPEMRGLWAARFVEETLLVHTRKGVGESGAGPIIAMVDISPSMVTQVQFTDGAQECVSLVSLAKAFAIALARYAATWNRRCVIVPFHSHAVLNQAVHAGGYNRKALRDQLKTLCAAKTTGGTDFESALATAGALIQQNPDEYEYADIVFFTDGQGGAHCDCGRHFPSGFKGRTPPRGWRDDILIRDWMRGSQENILRRCNVPEGVRTYALLLSGGGYLFDDSGRRVYDSYTGDGVPMPDTYADGLEHTNMHMFHECVACEPNPEAMQRAVTRFYSLLVSEAFYREV